MTHYVPSRNESDPFMDPEDKARWTAALRSEKYRQGQGVLRRRPTTGGALYCCLGVYAMECGVKFEPISPAMGGGTVFAFDFENAREDYTTLPEEWAQPRGISDEAQNILMKMNDEDGRTFAEIADWVDANL